jgi:hypothetical protein
MSGYFSDERLNSALQGAFLMVVLRATVMQNFIKKLNCPEEAP